MATVDLSVEQEFLRRSQQNGNPPQVLDLAELRTRYAEDEDATNYRLEDLLKTLLYQRNGADFVYDTYHKSPRRKCDETGVKKHKDSSPLYNMWCLTIDDDTAVVSLRRRV